jgi:hypothetical protein
MIRDHDLNNAIYSLEARTDLKTLNFTQGAVKDMLSYLKELQKIRDLEKFADYLIENASEAFEHQDRELLTDVLRRWNK